MAKPLTIAAASRNMSALIINVNSPRVMMLIGRVISNMTGRMIALTKPKIIAAITAEVKLETVKPGTT